MHEESEESEDPVDLNMNRCSGATGFAGSLLYDDGAVDNRVEMVALYVAKRTDLFFH